MPIATGIRPDRIAAALQYLQDMGNKRESVIDESGREYTIPAKGEAPAWYDKALPMEGRATFLPFQDSAPGSVMNKRELALPGIVAGAVNALTAPGRALSGSDPTFNAPEEAANVAMNVMGSSAGGVVKPAPAGQLGMTAYHGSPHTFDKFSLDKIGTGEGAQAYGHGLYLAETPDVAQAYANKLTTVNGQAVSDQLDGRVRYLNMLKQQAADGDVNAAKNVPVIERSIAELKRQGSLYKTDIPDEAVARFLDWDKPVSAQHPDVQAALGTMLNKAKKSFPLLNPAVDPDGSQAYKIYADHRGGNAAAASEELAQAGIPGIRYLDGGSRGAGQGSSNFVSFDPEMIRILERNGVPTGAQAWKPGEYQGKLAELLSNGNKE